LPKALLVPIILSFGFGFSVGIMLFDYKILHPAHQGSAENRGLDGKTGQGLRLWK
jgi:hypothetical protein